MDKIFKYILKNKLISIIIAIVAFTILVFTVVLSVKINSKKKDLLGTQNYDVSTNIEITIPKGAYLSDIANILYKNKIILYYDEFIDFAKERGNSSKYKFGVFSLNPDMSYSELDKKLQENAPLQGSIKITIPEGYEVRQIIALLEEKGLGTAAKYTDIILNSNFDYWFLQNIKKSEVWLEGYLFPATYTFLKNTNEQDVLNTMLKKFDSVFNNDMKQKAKELNMSVNEIITLASIVEREAANDSERDIVASVFYNRLNSSSYPYLESCATVQYILKERKSVLSIADTKISSPYNTYVNPGLPPHPIASPGLNSIEATLNPATSDYLFFVLGENGKHIFSKTYAEHLNAKNRGN